MSNLFLDYNRDILLKSIRDNCGPITLTLEDLLSCVGPHSGIDSWRCESLIKRKIRQSHDEALERTLFPEAKKKPLG
jgi:hypothetical protein